MLVKVNSIDLIKRKQLDIDGYGSIIPLKELELNISGDDESVIQILKNASYAATQNNIEDNSNTIILANGMTMDELSKDKSKTNEPITTAIERLY